MKKKDIEKETSPEKIIQRSQLSLEGSKPPLSMYTRRVIDVSKISNYLTEESTHGLCGGKNLENKNKIEKKEEKVKIEDKKVQIIEEVKGDEIIEEVKKEENII